jgi:endonuclease III
LTHQAVYALLLWEASTSQAHAALRRVLGAVVDYNELRVCQAEHVAEWLGEKYPLATERALRLRAFLGDVYERQQSVQLAPLLLGSRKDTHQTLAALEGMTAFAAARVVALGLSRSACPVDDRLLALLRREKAVLPDATPEAIGQELGDMAGDEGRIELLAKLQYWSDQEGHAPERGVPGREPVPTGAGGESSAARGARSARAPQTHVPGVASRSRGKRAKGQEPGDG